MTIDVTCDCEMTFPTIDITTHGINNNSNGGYNVRLTPASLGLNDTVFPDGVYSFSFRIARLDGSSQEETICSAALCQTYCDYIEHLAEYPNSDVYKYFRALEYLEQCDECDCKYGCAIFQELINNLNNPDDAQKDPCNCN